MTNVRKIHVDWYGQHPPRFNGGPQLAYQGDHLSNMVVFDHAPELPNYYLLVEMKTDDAGPVVTLPEILLEGPYWVIPNYYTQICQKITYQVCCKTESGDFEHHSAKFEGTILPVIKHNGEPIDQSPMFDPYIDILDKRVDELIVAAGDIQIDSELKNDSGNPVQNRVIKAKIDEIDENAIALNGRLQEYESATKSAVSSSTVLNNFWRDAEVGSAISGSASSNWQSATYPAKAGERYFVETVSYGTNVHCIVFLDADNVVVGRDAVASASANTNVNQTVVAPAGTAKVIINKHSATAGDVGIVYAMAWNEGIERNATAISETKTDVEKIDSFIKVSVDSSAVKNNFYRDAEVGSPITGSASNNWQCATFSVDENNWYFINTVIYGNRIHGIVFLDANNVVIGREVIGTSNVDTEISYEIKAPYGAVKMIVNKHSATAGDVGTVKKTAWDNGISAVDPYNIVESTKPTVIAHNKAQKCLNFAFITDLHINGYYGGEEAMQTLDLFIKAVSERFVDFSVFGGDLYSAYDLDYPSGIATADRSIEYLGKLNGLLLPVKGNHDCNAKFMALADASNLDWDNVTYYIYSNASHGYVSVTEETWDGESPLHYGSFPDMTQAFTNSEYYTLMQSRLGESVTVDEDNPFSAWYYKDFDRYKIRAVVLDAFDAGDGETTGMHGTQLKWIAEHALNLSGKTDWQVIFFSHYYAESGTYATKFKEVTDAFISGGSVSGTLNGVSYSADYSEQGEGTIVALIHGHRHADRYSDAFGYNHIGVTRAFATSAELNTASAYAFDVFTIDRDESKIYETRFGRGTSRAYNYGSTVGLIQ